MVAKRGKQTLGKWGEEQARVLLMEKGYLLVGENIRPPYGEIDLVLRDGETLVFVEVKTRTTRTFGLPEEAITPAKIEHMAASAESYIQELDAPDTPWRLDVVSVYVPGGAGNPEVVHIPNVQA